jgi:hypothetical protein
VYSKTADVPVWRPILAVIILLFVVALYQLLLLLPLLLVPDRY